MNAAHVALLIAMVLMVGTLFTRLFRQIRQGWADLWLVIGCIAVSNLWDALAGEANSPLGVAVIAGGSALALALIYYLATARNQHHL